MSWRHADITLLFQLIPRNTSRQPGAQQEANRQAQRSPLTLDALCQGLVYFTHIKDHMPQFHSTAGALAPIPAPIWPVMDGVDSYKPSTKWSNTKVKVEAASVVWLTMKGLHSRKMLFILNTNYAVSYMDTKGFSHLKPWPLLNSQSGLAPYLAFRYWAT